MGCRRQTCFVPTTLLGHIRFVASVMLLEFPENWNRAERNFVARGGVACYRQVNTLVSKKSNLRSRRMQLRGKNTLAF